MNKVLEYFKGDELAASTWQNKYAAQGEITPDDTHKRLAKEFARIEEYYNHNLNSENKLKLSEYGCSRSPLTEDAIFELFKDFINTFFKQSKNLIHYFFKINIQKIALIIMFKNQL